MDLLEIKCISGKKRGWNRPAEIVVLHIPAIEVCNVKECFLIFLFAVGVLAVSVLLVKCHQNKPQNPFYI